MSYATENWLRKQLRAHQQVLARAADLLKRVKDDEPWTTRDLDTVLEEAEKDRYGWRPYAAFAAQAIVHQKYPVGGPMNSLEGNPPRMFHHNGHALGVLYWWRRAGKRTPGPHPLLKGEPFLRLFMHPTIMEWFT